MRLSWDVVQVGVGLWGDGRRAARGERTAFLELVAADVERWREPFALLICRGKRPGVDPGFKRLNVWEAKVGATCADLFRSPELLIE